MKQKEKKESKLKPYRVISNREMAKDVFLLAFERDFDFTAGQYIGITTRGDMEPRLYSLASGSQEPEAVILYSVNHAGILTPELAELKPGDTVFSSPPAGRFRFLDGDAWWIATGTGIAPFRSMWRSGHRNVRRIIQGGRYHDSFYFSDEFEGLGSDYIRCVTAEPSAGMHTGRVTGYLASLENIPKDVTFYLCGSAGMVVEARDILIAGGVSFERIVSEIYF